MLLALVVGACGDSVDKAYKFEEIGNLEDISKVQETIDPSDSMMFYFGAMQANNYLQDAVADTLLKTDEARADFLKGFRTALTLDEDNSAHNKGLQLGLRLAIRLRELEERYGKDFSEDILAASLQYYINNPDSLHILEAQKGYYDIKDHYELVAAQKDVESAKSNLAKAGKENGFTMLSDTLYVKDISEATNGPTFKEGDRIAVEVTASTLEGEEIATRQFPDSITLGEGKVPAVVREGIYTMTNGQTRQFMTTPRTLLGKRLRIYNLDPEVPVIFTVKAEQN